MVLFFIFYGIILQLYNRRESVLKGEKERKYWKEIDFNLMSQESSDDNCAGNTVFKVHSPAWRSPGLL